MGREPAGARTRPRGCGGPRRSTRSLLALVAGATARSRCGTSWPCSPRPSTLRRAASFGRDGPPRRSSDTWSDRGIPAPGRPAARVRPTARPASTRAPDAREGRRPDGEPGSVTVDGEVVGEISDGLLVLVGVTHTDTPQTAETMARKVHELRILDDEQSAADDRRADAGGEPVHPLRRYAQGSAAGLERRGARRRRRTARRRDRRSAGSRGATVATGRFRTHMLVASVNVGPRTVIVDL